MASAYANFSTALYTKTNVSAVVGSGKLSGIFESKAPQGQAYPFGVWNMQGASPIDYAFDVTPVSRVFYIQMRVYASNQMQAENLLATWVATLGNSLTVTGFTVEWLAEQNALPPTDALEASGYVYGRGTLIKVGLS